MSRSHAALLSLLLVVATAAPVLAQQGSGDVSFTFTDQTTGGHSVLVDQVNLPEGGFVAIHDSTLLEDADPLGSVIGVSAFLAAGEHTALRVPLTRALQGQNETAIVMPHKDTNGNQLYEFVSSGGADDGPYTGGPQALSGLEGDLAGFNGVSAKPSKATVSASVDVNDQRQAGRSLLVDFVDLSGPGFIAIHDSTLVDDPESNVFSSVVGVSEALPAGVHRNVVVPLTFNEEKKNNTGTLIAMAHKDTNSNSQYEFVESQGADDGPFVGQEDNIGGIVYDVAEVTYGGSARTTFESQATGGHLVMVAEVFLPKGGFLAIHDETLVTEGDPLGSVVGVSEKLGRGLHRDVAIELTFGGSDGIDRTQTLYAMPHKDTNDNDQYDFVSSQGADDGPYTGGDDALSGLEGDLAGFNGIVAVGAEATLSAGTVFRPQSSDDGRTVRVAYVDLSEPGFIAFHDASLLASLDNVFSSVVGTSERLDAGVHEDVVVTLAAAPGGEKNGLQAPTTLVAMPHKDTNGNGVYDFITSQGADDGPFTASAENKNTVTDNGIVVSPAFVTAPFASANAGTGGTGGTGGTDAGGNGTGGTDAGGNGTGNGAGGPADENAGTPTGESTPGFGLVALVAAMGAAAFVFRRRG